MSRHTHEGRFERLRRGDDRVGPQRDATQDRTIDARPSAGPTTPGKSTLVDTHEDGHPDPAREAMFQVSHARAQLSVLGAAIRARHAEQSALAASEIKAAVHYAHRAVAHAWLIRHAEADRLRASVADLEKDAEPLLATAFKPSETARRRTRTDSDRSSYEMEKSKWKTSAADIAARSMQGLGERLPHFERIQASFGQHDVSSIRAHIGGSTVAAARQLGARAFAFGDRIAFADTPDLHTAAHEAAHHVQQRGGVALKGEIDQPGDEYEQHADAVADAVVRGESAAPLLDQFAGRRAHTTSRAPLVQRKTDSTSTSTPSSAKRVESGHESYKLKVEFGTGTVTGGVVLTFENGKSAEPIAGDRLRAFKNTASIRLNGFVTKLETAVLSGKFSDEVFDGVKVGIEISTIKASKELTKAKVKLDLFTIAVKLQGDVSHWLALSHDVKLTLDGQIQIALGDKLVEELGHFIAADVERRSLAIEIEEVGGEIEKHVTEVRKLEKKIASLETSGSRAEIRELEQQLLAHRLQVSTGTQQIERLSQALDVASQRTTGALYRLRGKLAKKLGWAMERESVKMVGQVFKRLIPVLTVVSIALDVRDAVKFFRAMVKLRGQFVIGPSPGDGGDHIGPPGAGADADPTTMASAPDVSGSDTGASSADVDDSSGSTPDAASVAAARASMSPAAQRIVDSVTRRGGAAPQFSPDQLATLDVLIPADLAPGDVDAVIANLHTGAHAQSTQEAFEAIDKAVRDVRNRGRTLVVDGVARPDLATDAQPDVASSQSSGLITSPHQLEPATDETTTIVESAPPELIATWFVLDADQLVMNAIADRWKAENVRHVRVHGRMLIDMTATTKATGPGAWDLEIVFELDDGRAMEHRFFVGNSTRGIVGASVGGLSFEPYEMVQ